MFQTLFDFVLTAFLLAVTLNIAFAFIQSDPYTGCALSSVVRDITCRNASSLMQPMTQGCDIYVTVRDAICPPLFRTQWYL